VANRGLLRAGVLVLPAVLLIGVFFVFAMALLLEMSINERGGATSSTTGLTASNFADFLTSRYYLGIVGTTFKLAAVTTLVTLLIGYLAAYAISLQTSGTWRALSYFALFTPLLTSVIVRSYGWQLLLDDHGFVNSLLLSSHILRSPIRILFDFSGVVIAMVHILLPFMAFPILSVLNQIGSDLSEAASDLGAGRWQVFSRVTLPLSLPGVLVGCELVFALSVSAFATPSILGGGRVLVLATLIYTDVTSTLNWPFAAAEAYVLLTLAILAVVVFNRLVRASYRARGVL
jgi:putative spermidine/putrescine transport system permease protein